MYFTTVPLCSVIALLTASRNKAIQVSHLACSTVCFNSVDPTKSTDRTVRGPELSLSYASSSLNVSTASTMLTNSR